MSRRVTLQNSFTKGVLDKRLAERIDLVHYYSGLRTGTNCAVRPQGGAYRRPGTVLAPGADLVASGDKRRLRRRLQPVNITDAQITVHNSGTAASLVDQSQTTDFATTAVAGATFVLFEVDFGAIIPITFVDLLRFQVATAAVDKALAVEYWDGAAWVQLGTRQHLRTTRRWRRFAVAPGKNVSTRYIRAVVYNGAGAGIVSIGGLRVWQEKGRLSPVKLIRFARDEVNRFEMVLTDYNIDIYEDHRWVAACLSYADATQVPRTNYAQSLDTLLLYHEDVETPVITRQGADDEWNHQAAVFTNVPTLTAATAFAGNQNEIQDLALPGISAGKRFVLIVDDEVTAPIEFTDAASLPAAVSAALDALPSVAAAPVVTLQGETPVTVRIEYNSTNGSRRWAPATAIVLDDDVLDPVTTVVQRGINASGTYASRQTGFARCGLLYQSRHIMGGFRAAPQTVVSSRTGQPFDLRVTASPMTADLGFIDTFDTEEIETIYAFVVGKHLQAFTATGTWFCETRVLDATQPRQWRLGTRPGAAPGVPIAYQEDATLFVQEGGNTLRQMLLASGVETEYTADPINLLSPELVAGVTDFAVLAPRKTDDGAICLMVRADGAIAALMMLRSQEMIAVLPWQTATGDKFRAVLADNGGRLWCVVERTNTDGTELYLERFDIATPLDMALSQTFLEATADVSGLDHLEGRSVYAFADGDLFGPYTVTDGAITLERAASAVTVGLFTPFELEPMPIREKLANGYPFRPPGRVYEIGLTLKDTGYLEISTNGGPFRPVPLTHVGETMDDAGPFGAGGRMDLPMLDRLYTGTRLLQNLLGWSKHPRWTLRQTLPAPVEVLSVRAEMSFRS